MSQKKKFKETKVGAFLGKNAPDILDAIGDFFPPAAIVARIVNPELEKLDKAKQEEFYKLLDEEYEKERAYALENTADARDMYASSKAMSDNLANRIMSYNLPVMGVMIVINVLCVLWLNSALLAIVSNVIGQLMQQLANERTTVVNFFFGSSLGSKTKDKAG